MKKEEEVKKARRKSMKDYDFSSEPHLEIFLSKAIQLRSGDITGFSDPYVVFSNGGVTISSKIKYQTLNPKWNELLLLPVKKEDKVLEITVNDWDPFKSPDFLGKAFVSIDDLIRNNETSFNIKLSLKGSIEFNLTAKNFGQKSTAKEIALFGSQGSGKSTFMKQFQHTNSLISPNFKYSFLTSLLDITRTCINVCLEKDKKEPFEIKDNQFYSEWILEIFKDDEFYTSSVVISLFKSPGIATSFISLWNDSKMKSSLKSLIGTSKLIYFYNLPDYLDKNLSKFRVSEDTSYVIEDYIIILKNVFEKGKLSLKDDLNLIKDEIVTPNWDEYKKLLFEKTIIDYVAKTDYSGLISTPFSKFSFLNYHKLKPVDPKDCVHLDPSIDDLLVISEKSSGIHFDKTIKYLEKEICLIETSGAPEERSKWKYLASDHSIYCSIYIIDLSSFDQVNENGKNRLLEDIEVFKYYLSLFKDNQLVLHFNKNDEFQKKSKEIDLNTIFPDYKGGKSYPFALKYIVDKYRNLFKGSQKLVSSHIGSALNPKEISKVLALILKGNPLLLQYEITSPTPKKQPLDVKKIILEEKKEEKLENLISIDTFYERIERQKKMTKEEIEKEEEEYHQEITPKTPKVKCKLCNDLVGFVLLNGCSELLCNECFSMVQSSGTCPICDKEFNEVTNVFTNQTMKIE